jgi:hypothetical protein
MDDADNNLNYCNLARPGCFALHYASLVQGFINNPVYLPRGFEREGQDTGEISRPSAPMPCTLHSENVQFMATQTLDGYVSAHGISFLQQGGMTGRLLAISIEAELKLFSRQKNDKAHAPGPHGSHPPRCCALSLLCPRARGGRPSTNRHDLILLNALSRIAESPANGIDALKEENAEPTPSKVRFAVLAGLDDVASFMKEGRVRMNDASWRQTTALCLSYAASSGTVTLYIPIESSHATIEEAAACIQEKCKLAQMQSDRAVVLPSPLLCKNDVVDLTNWDENSKIPMPFLLMQARLQNEFKLLFFPRPVCDPEHSAACRAISNGAGRPLRIGWRFSPYREVDPEHCIGYLFAKDAGILDVYLQRCRSAVAGPFCKNKVTFELLQLNPDEQCAEIVIFWFKVQRMPIGKKLSLFAPRALLGTPLTALENSWIQQVVPLVSTLDSLLKSYWVIPCTHDSLTPERSQDQQALATAFARVSLESFEALKKAPEDPPVKIEAVANNDAVDGELAADHAAILGCLPGHPCTTVGQAYDALRHDIEESKLTTYAFHGLLTRALAQFGRDESLDAFFSKCNVGEDAQLSGRLSPRKRKTPTPLEDASPAADNLLDLTEKNEKRMALATLAGCRAPTPVFKKSFQIANGNIAGTYTLALLWGMFNHNDALIKQKGPALKKVQITFKREIEFDDFPAEFDHVKESVRVFILAGFACIGHERTKELITIVRRESVAKAFLLKGESTATSADVMQLLKASDVPRCILWLDVDDNEISVSISS